MLAMPIEYNSSAMLRCRAIIEGLIEGGNDVKCFAPFPDTKSKYYSPTVLNNFTLFNYGDRNKTFNSEEIVHSKKGLKQRIKRIAYKIYKKYDVFGSSVLYLKYKKEISNELKKGKYDLLLSFSDPMPAHMIANYCKKRNKSIRYVQQWGDPLAADTIGKTALPFWIRKRIEKRMLRFADKVCYVSPFTCEEQKNLFRSFADKMFFLPTPYLKYQINDCAISKKAKPLCFGYFGSYSSTARNIIPFYNAACRMKEMNFYIIGDSNVVLNSTSNVIVKNRMNHDELSSFFENVDVVVCLMNIKGNQIPGKVYHDASTTKDILLIKDGEFGDKIESFFSKYNHYTFVDNEEQAILNLLMDYAKKGVPIRTPVEDFDPKVVAKQLIE